MPGYAACPADSRARNPLPDITRRSKLADPRQRLRCGLRDLYSYYEQTEPMLANVICDAEHIPAPRAVAAPRRQWLAQAEEQLARGWQGYARQIRHAIALALDFRTWQTPGARRRGVLRVAAHLAGGTGGRHDRCRFPVRGRCGKRWPVTGAEEGGILAQRTARITLPG